MALIDFSQIKGGKQVLTDIAGKFEKANVVKTTTDRSAADYEFSDERVLSEAMVEQKLASVTASQAKHVDDTIILNASLGSAVTTFTCSAVPTENKLIMVMNGINYVEDDDTLSVNRETKTVTWLFTAANGGFDINAALTDEVHLVYLTLDQTSTGGTVTGDNGGGESGGGESGGGESGGGESGGGESGGGESGGGESGGGESGGGESGGGQGGDTPTNVSWTADVTYPINSVEYDIKGVLTAAQLADITDDNAAGPEADGMNRYIGVAFIGTDSKPCDPIDLPWVESGLANPVAATQDIIDAGYTPGVNAPRGGYFLDSDKVLGLASGAQTFKLRITKYTTTVSNPA